jgi:dipeptidyl aminopeptidase/acylaminoacyl peptidase
LFVRDVGGDAIIAPKLGDNKIRSVRFAGDDFVLVSASATIADHEIHHIHPSHYEILSILVVNLKTKKISYALQDMGGFQQLISADYGPRRIGEKWVGFYSSNDDGLYRFDFETARTERVADEGLMQSDWLIGPAGEIAARVINNQRLHTWKLTTPDGAVVRQATTNADGADPEVLGFGRTAGTALVRERSAEGDLIEEYPLTANAKPTTLLQGADSDSLLFDPVSQTFIGAQNDIDSKVTIYDPKLAARLAGVVKAFPGLQSHPVSYTPNFDRMIALTEGGTDNGTFWLIDLTTGKAEELADRYPEITPEKVGPTRMVHYNASDGLGMEGVLTLPPNRNPQSLPLVVMPHGGPVGVRDFLGFDWWAQAFASRGYAVFQPNYRGSGGYGLAFEKASQGEWGRKMQTDLSDAVTALSAQGMVDPKRVCIVGASYGGYAALAGVTLQQGIYRCAVSVAGISEVGALLSHRNTDRSDVGRYLKAQLGAGWAGSAELAKISPLYNVEQASAPILIMQGTDDTVVDPRQAEWMRRALEKAGKVVKYVPLTGDDHWLSRSDTRTRMLVESVEFVEANNPSK